MARICGTLIAAGAILFAAGCGGGSTPEKAFKDFQAAVKAKDADKAWALISKETQAEMDKGAKTMVELVKVSAKLTGKGSEDAAAEEVAKGMGITAAELKTMDGKKLFGLVLTNPKLNNGKDLGEVLGSATLENVKVEGEKATATVKTSEKSRPIEFLKESGAWKIKLPPMKGGK